MPSFLILERDSIAPQKADEDAKLGMALALAGGYSCVSPRYRMMNGYADPVFFSTLRPSAIFPAKGCAVHVPCRSLPLHLASPTLALLVLQCYAMQIHVPICSFSSSSMFVRVGYICPKVWGGKVFSGDRETRFSCQSC